MKDQSQIDAMRAAIRGDLERSRARQQANQVLQPPDGGSDRIQPVPETDPEPGPEPELELKPEPEPEPAKQEPRPSIFSSVFKRR